MNTAATAGVRERSAAWLPAAGFSRRSHLAAMSALRRPRPWAWVGAAMLTWSIIAGAIVVTEVCAWLLPLSWLVIASRQHALGVLMHDGAHGSIHRNPRINLFLADMVAAWSIGITTAGFRRSHLAHHAHTHTERDPDLRRKLADGVEEWTAPMPTRRLARELLLDLLGRGAWRMMRRAVWYGAGPVCSLTLAHHASVGRWVFAVALGVAITMTGTWWHFAAYWLVPLLFVLPPLLRVRSLAEHFGLSHEDTLTSSRDVEGNWIEAQMFGPFGIRWHLVHHLFPDIPAVSIGRAQRLLRRDPAYRRRGARAHGYLFGDGSVRVALAHAGGDTHV